MVLGQFHQKYLLKSDPEEAGGPPDSVNIQLVFLCGFLQLRKHISPTNFSLRSPKLYFPMCTLSSNNGSDKLYIEKAIIIKFWN